ncbi:hypothetical protein D1872_51960 [compost metagenome]
MQINIVHPLTKDRIQLFQKEKIAYTTLEISPSKMTSNVNVRWLLAEFSRLFTPFHKRINVVNGCITYTPELNIWWEIVIKSNSIKFLLTVPDIDHIKHSLTRHIMKTWKQSNVKEISDPMPNLDPTRTSISKLYLKNHSLLSLDTQNPNYSLVESLLNAKHYLKDDDVALLQIGLNPTGPGWNDMAIEQYTKVKDGHPVPRKRGKLTKGDILRNIMYGIGLLAEELFNLLGDFLIPGWKNDRAMTEALKGRNGEIESTCTRNKIRSDAFNTDIRVVAQSDNQARRKDIVRSIISGFDPLEGDNQLLEQEVDRKKIDKEIGKIMNRKMTVKMNGNVLCALELAKIINVPDQKAQVEHYNELSLVSHRGEAEVPKEIFVDDGGVPFATYEDTDGKHKTIYFNASNKNLLCMPRVIIGEPGTGKTTLCVGDSIESLVRGYGGMVVDAADGKLVSRILSLVPPDLKHKVKIIDFTNTEYPIGLGWNEIFTRVKNTDIIEDLIVEEIFAFIHLVTKTELNMRSKQWVENAIKATFTTPDATLQDVESMLNNAEYRAKVIPNITDPELKSDWLYYHEKLKPEERKTIYDEAWRRLAPVMRKKALKNFILQKPKKDNDGNYVFDLRKWMDEGCLVLVKANETLGETLQTALVSFLISKLNLAMVSREDVYDEDDRQPCFLRLDEPDHYIKGSERWRNMLTRFRKYRCGLNLYFHGWQQLKEADKDLPKIIRKAGPHYIIFQTDEDNLLDLRPVIEPEFKVQEVAKGMPQYHAVIRLKMYNNKGNVIPAFMAKALDMPEKRFPKYDNDDLYESCALELGRPKEEVMNEIFKPKASAEFDIDLTIPTSTEGDGDLIELLPSQEDPEEEKRRVSQIITYEVSKFLDAQIARGEDPDEDLVLEMDSLLEEG